MKFLLIVLVLLATKEVAVKKEREREVDRWIKTQKMPCLNKIEDYFSHAEQFRMSASGPAGI